VKNVDSTTTRDNEVSTTLR